MFRVSFFIVVCVVYIFFVVSAGKWFIFIVWSYWDFFFVLGVIVLDGYRSRFCKCEIFSVIVVGVFFVFLYKVIFFYSSVGIGWVVIVSCLFFCREFYWDCGFVFVFIRNLLDAGEGRYMCR